MAETEVSRRDEPFGRGGVMPGAVHSDGVGGGAERWLRSAGACVPVRDINGDAARAVAGQNHGQTGARVGSAPVLGATNLAAVQIGEKRQRKCRSYAAGTPPMRRCGWG